MDLTQAFQESRYIETTINGTHIIIERFNGSDDVAQCWQYDMHTANQVRYHNTQYGTLQDDVLASIYEDGWRILEDGQLEQADWQPTKKTIDITDCICRDCIRFCLECKTIPKDMEWHLAMRYRVKWTVENVVWRVRIRWMLLQEKYHLYR